MPFRVFFIAITVPILRSASMHGFLTHILSPGFSFSTLSPPALGVELLEYARTALVYNILYTQNNKRLESRSPEDWARSIMLGCGSGSRAGEGDFQNGSSLIREHLG